MNNVVSLTKPKLMVFVCNCGCSTFTLESDGCARCAACDTVASCENGWQNAIEGTPERDGENFMDIAGNGSEEFARRRVGKLASDDDVAMVIVIKDSGLQHTWSKAETPEQFAWEARQMRAAQKMLKEWRSQKVKP